MNRDEIRTRIAELDKQINSEIAGSRMPSATPRRPFPVMTWVLAAAALGWMYFGAQIPGAEHLHADYHEVGLYSGGFFGLVALWGTLLFLIQPSTKITPEYQESTQRVRMLQEERRDLMAQLRALEQ